MHVLTTLPKKAGKRPPGAIVLLSDGSSNVGTGPLAAARQAKADHIPVYTISLGTPNGTIPIKTQRPDGQRAGPGELAGAGADRPELRRQGLHRRRQRQGQRGLRDTSPSQLGHKKVKREITADVAGGGLVLLLVGGAMTLLWFGRII